jgi:hypothetical protein
MRHYTAFIAATALCSAVCVPSIVHAAGLGNLTYTQQEVGHGIALFNAANMPDGPSGADSVIMVHGLLVVLGTKDSGVPPGTFHVYDVKDPRNPALLKTFTSPQTAHLAEWHMAGMAKVNGKDILVCRTTTGIAFFDFTDPMNPSDVAMLDLTGVSGGDYTNAAWMNSWSWPYVFTGSSGSGVNVTDATDPSKPVLIKTIPIGQTGNFRVGGLYAAGNYLVITNMDESPLRASVLDVSNPKAPSLLTTTSAPNGAYSLVVIGDWIFGSGEGAHYTFMKWSPASIQIVDQKVFGADKGAYCTYQDGFGICGQSSEGFKKIDLHDVTNIHVVTQGVLSQAQAEGGDFDFATVMGNLVFQGNDHGSGNGFLPHQTEPDTTPPDVYKIYPPDQSTKQPLSTRITIFFTDEIDTDTVNANSIILRKVGGSAVTGNFSHSSTNAISFGPAQPLDANSTYEIVVTAGGVADLVGNAIVGQTIARFSTGGSIVAPADGGAADSGSSDDAGSAGVGGAIVMGSGGAGVAAGSGGVPDNGNSAGTLDTGGGTGGGGTAALTGNSAAANSNGGCACSVPGQRKNGSGLSMLATAFGLALWHSRVRRRRARGASQ